MGAPGGAFRLFLCSRVSLLRERRDAYLCSCASILVPPPGPACSQSSFMQGETNRVTRFQTVLSSRFPVFSWPPNPHFRSAGPSLQPPASPACLALVGRGAPSQGPPPIVRLRSSSDSDAGLRSDPFRCGMSLRVHNGTGTPRPLTFRTGSSRIGALLGCDRSGRHLGHQCTTILDLLFDTLVLYYGVCLLGLCMSLWPFAN